MTTTASLSSQSVGTSTNVGPGKFPQKVTIQATTTAFNIACRVTNGAGSYDLANRITCFYVSSPFDVTAAASVSLLRGTAQQMDITPSPNAGIAVSRNTDLVPVLGSYIYFWFDIPTVSVAQTLDASCVELP